MLIQTIDKIAANSPGGNFCEPNPNPHRFARPLVAKVPRVHRGGYSKPLRRATPNEQVLRQRGFFLLQADRPPRIQFQGKDLLQVTFEQGLVVKTVEHVFSACFSVMFNPSIQGKCSLQSLSPQRVPGSCK